MDILIPEKVLSMQMFKSGELSILTEQNSGSYVTETQKNADRTRRLGEIDNAKNKTQY